MPIKKLTIKNFKSIKNLSLDCKRINILIGEPNTGKSNILEAIGVLSHVPYGQIADFVRFEIMTDLFYDRVLDDPIILDFDSNVLRIEFKNGLFEAYLETPPKEGEALRLIPYHAFTYSYQGGMAQNYVKTLLEFKYYRFARRTIFGNQKSEFLMPPSGDNLLAVIMTRKRLKEIVKDIFGKFGYRVVLRPQEGKIDIQKESEDIIISFPYFTSSETLQRLVFYLAAIYSNKDSVISIEEPEAHAFPYYTKYLAERIALDENKNQYFIATHNPYFLTSILEKTPKEEVEIFTTSLHNYQTIVKPLNEEQKKDILSDMGYDVFFNIEKFLS